MDWTTGTLTLGSASNPNGNTGYITVQNGLSGGMSVPILGPTAGLVLTYISGNKTGKFNFESTGNSWSGGTIVNSGVANAGQGILQDPFTVYVGGGTSATNGVLGTGTITLNNALLSFDEAAAYSYSVSNTIAGSGAVTQAGNATSTITLSGPNTYAGPTTVASGTLSVSTLNKVSGGASSSSLGAPTTVANGTIGLGGTTASGTYGSQVVVPTTGTLVDTGTGETTDRVLLLVGNGTLTQSGTNTLNFSGGVASTIAAGTSANKTLTLQGSTAGIGQISGVIADAPASDNTPLATFANASTTLWINNAANLYSAGATITGNGIAANTYITAVSGNTVTLNQNSNLAETLSSVTISGASTTAVTKTGSGTWVLSNANTYTGGTTVTAGTLVATNGSGSATGSGAVGVSAGATLAGTGSINATGGAINLNGTGTSTRANVLVGQTSSSDTNTTSSMSLVSTPTSTFTDANLSFNLNGNVAGALGSSPVNSGNVLNVGATNISFGAGNVLTLNLFGTKVIAAYTPYELIVGTGTTTLGSLTTGQFAGLNVSTTPNAQGLYQILGSGNGALGNLSLVLTGNAATYYGANSYLFLYQSGSGVNAVDAIEVEVVPEPSTWAMMLGGLAVLVFWQRRKSKLS